MGQPTCILRADDQPDRHRWRLLALGLCLAMASGCTTTYASQGESDNRIGGAVQQPFRDVSLVREDPPEILKRAAAEPYFLDVEFDCGSVLAEIAELDLVLGPDVDKSDVDTESSADAGGLTAGAIGSVMGLPFRGIIRTLSGAEQRDKVLADAILSGVARRSYLKGAAHAAGCPPLPAP